MTTCPVCGVAGNNFSCPNHISYWGINPLPDSIPSPHHGGIQLTHPINTELFAEIGRLNVLLNERDKEIAALNEILAGLRQKGVIDGLNRPLPLKGHHFQCSHGRDGWSLCTCEELRKADTERMESLANELAEEQEAKPGCPKCGDTGRVTITDGTIATGGWCECSKQFADLVAAGQKLRKEFDQKTAGMRGPPTCSICGDTGLVFYGPGYRGMKRCDCRRKEIIKDTKPTRDFRQVLKVGDVVRFELTGVITDRQSAGIIEDENGNDYEPIQYKIEDRVTRIVNYVPYHHILSVVGKEE